MITPRMEKTTVALMLKAPRAGQVKTRLAHAIGERNATEAYRRLVEHQIKQIPSEWTTTIHFTPVEAAAEMKKWLGPGHAYQAQSDGNLGRRLEMAMNHHFATSQAPLIFLGADCPYLTTSFLQHVGAFLAQTAVVMVSALDGGYCLLALRQQCHRVFREIPWETASIAEETRQRLREERVDWQELPALEDVDDESSWNRAKVAFPDLTATADGIV